MRNKENIDNTVRCKCAITGLSLMYKNIDSVNLSLIKSNTKNTLTINYKYIYTYIHIYIYIYIHIYIYNR